MGRDPKTGEVRTLDVSEDAAPADGRAGSMKGILWGVVAAVGVPLLVGIALELGGYV